MVRSARFVLLAIVMTAAGFGLYAATINLVPLLVSRGASLSTAALGLGLVGVGQVSGRLVFGPLCRVTSPGGRITAVVVVGGVCVAVLGLVPGPVGLLVAVAVAAGGARGMHTLLQASAVSDRWGTASFGRINGVFSAPRRSPSRWRRRAGWSWRGWWAVSGRRSWCWARSRWSWGRLAFRL